MSLRKYFVHSVLALTVLISLLAGSLAVSADAIPPVVSISPSVVDDLDPGDTFTVAVQVDSGVQTRGMMFELQYDPAVLKANAVTEGSFYGAHAAIIGGSTLVYPAPVINNTLGHIQATGIAIMGGTPATGPTGAGAAFNIEFQVLAATGDSALQLSGVSVSDAGGSEIPGTVVQNGQFFNGVAPMPNLKPVTFALTNDGTDKYTVSFAVQNTGTDDAVASTAAVAIDGIEVETFAITAVPAGAMSALQTTAAAYALPDGSQVQVIVDKNAEVAESNEGDNTFSYTYSSVTDDGDTIVDTRFGAVIEVTPPADVLNWTLVLGDNSSAGHNLNVKSNTTWQVDVTSDTNWSLTQFNGSTYGAGVLAQSLHALCSAEGTDVHQGSAIKIADGDVLGQNADLGEDFALGLTQYLEWGDPLLPAGQSYHTVLTFSGYVTI